MNSSLYVAVAQSCSLEVCQKKKQTLKSITYHILHMKSKKE